MKLLHGWSALSPPSAGFDDPYYELMPFRKSSGEYRTTSSHRNGNDQCCGNWEERCDDIERLAISVITTMAELEALYPEPVYPPAKVKEADRITKAYRALVEASPFCAMATNGPGELDCSPRGDPKGFVRVINENTIAVPDRRGNNRIDSLRNLINDPRVALLFLIPGVSETLRIMGRATISTDPGLCASSPFRARRRAACW